MWEIGNKIEIIFIVYLLYYSLMSPWQGDKHIFLKVYKLKLEISVCPFGNAYYN